MWRRFDFRFGALFWIGFPGYWLGSEIVYMRRIDPTGVSNVTDYFERFGDPNPVSMIEKDGRRYYKFIGPMSLDWVIAVPSGPPAYVFDEQGAFVAWCSDTGDADEFHRVWREIDGEPIDVATLRQRFAR